MLSLDVRDPHSVQQCVSEVQARAGKIDALVNNAGYALIGGAEESSDAEIAAQFDTNFYGVVRLIRAVLPGMRSRRHGRIVNISSLAGQVPLPFMGIYSASKHAVEAYSEALHHELLPLGVRVSLIEPGFMRTALGDHGHVISSPIADYSPWRQKAAESVRQHIARAPLPDPVAKAVVRALQAKHPKLRYLAGSEANLVTRLHRLLPEAMFGPVLRRQFGLQRV